MKNSTEILIKLSARRNFHQQRLNHIVNLCGYVKRENSLLFDKLPPETENEIRDHNFPYQYFDDIMSETWNELATIIFFYHLLIQRINSCIRDNKKFKINALTRDICEQFRINQSIIY